MTPLGIRRALLLAFPEFEDCVVVRPRPYHLHVYCRRGTSRVDEQRLAEWVRRFKPLASTMEVEQVDQLPVGLDDDSHRIRRTRLPFEAVEDARVTGAGILAALKRRWPTVTGLTDAKHGHVVVQVTPSTDTETQSEILAAMRVLLSIDTYSLSIEERVPLRAAGDSRLSAAATEADKASDDILWEHTGDVLVGVAPQFAPLPAGVSTYASALDGIERLVHRLSLFETVYVPMPRRTKAHKTYSLGADLKDFLDALPSGRIVPVFESNLEHYEPTLVDQIVNSGAPRLVFAAEARLRRLGFVVADNPIIKQVAALDPSARQLHAALRSLTPTDPRAYVMARYVDRIAELVSSVRLVAKHEVAFGKAWVPLSRFLDEAITLLHGRTATREMEILAGLEHRIACESLGATPMCRREHYLEPYLNLAYGASPGEQLPVTFDDPKAIGDVLLCSDRIPLSEFVRDFQSSAVARMRTLMQSPRWWEGATSGDVIREFEREMRHFNGNRVLDESACLVGMTNSLFLSGGVSVLASLGASLVRPLIEATAPDAADRLDAVLTSSTREGVLLAKIRRQLT